MEQYFFRFIRSVHVQNERGFFTPQFVIETPRDLQLNVRVQKQTHDSVKTNVTTRLVVSHRSFTEPSINIVGFTCVKTSQDLFEFHGICSMGYLYLIPIPSHMSEYPATSIHDHTSQEVDILYKTGTGILGFTRVAEAAIAVLFDMLDMDYNGWISRQELNFFKLLLGYEDVISDEEWLNIVCGWTENYLQPAQIQLSLSWFTSLLLRLTSAEEIWTEIDERLSPLRRVTQKLKKRNYQKSAEKILQFIFNSCGFDRSLRPVNVHGYSFDISTPRPSLSAVSIASFNLLPSDAVLKALTCTLGKKKTNQAALFTYYVYESDDWISLVVRNNSTKTVSVCLNCSDSQGLQPFVPGKSGFIWQNDVLPFKKLFVLRFTSNSSAAAIHFTCKLSIRNELGQVNTFTITCPSDADQE